MNHTLSKTDSLPGSTSRTWKKIIHDWLEQPGVQHALVALILLNAVTLGLENSAPAMERWGPWLLMIDRLILGSLANES